MEDELLIENVRQYDLLYNPQLSEYRDVQIRRIAWKEIGEELNIKGKHFIYEGAPCRKKLDYYFEHKATEHNEILGTKTTATWVSMKISGSEDAKNNWEKLRRSYINALSRRRVKKTNMPPWKYETQMSFLLPFLYNRKHNTNVCDTFVSADDSESIVTKEENDNSDELDDEACEIETLDMPSLPDNVKKDKRVHCDNTAKNLASKLNENKILGKRKFEEKCSFEDMDDTDMFFLSMGKMTKKLPPIEQAKIKKLLCNAVLDAQIELSAKHDLSLYSDPLVDQSQQ